MAEYPAEFEFDVLLTDGRSVQFRPIRPTDAEAERAFIHRVGPESSYFRFFHVKKDLSPEELRHFTTVDYDDRMAFIALHGDDMIAVGRYDVLHDKSTDDHTVAEVAFLVEDAWQGRGIGAHLLQHLTVYARLKGIDEFEAFVLADNRAMLRLFRDSGYRLTRQLDEGIYRVEFPIEYSLEAREAEWEHEKRAVTASLMPLLYPTSVAVIGASRDDRSIGGRLFRNLLLRGFQGPLYPVHPEAAFVHSVKAYARVEDLPGPVDLAFVVVPSEAVPSVVEACGRAGVRGLVVISAGFGEAGEEGATAERRLITTARRHGMRLVGPNCMGLLNTDPAVSLDGQFGPTFPPIGSVAMASQSGALGLALLEQASDLHLGLSTFVSLGNRADVSPNDLLLYWEDDPATDVVVLYVESFGNPRRFGRIARRVARTKPVVAVKAGSSSVGASAAASHTGSLAGLDVAVDALFRQAGVIRCRTLHELFDVTALLASQPLPRGRRVAVLSNAGGPGILAVDALESLGLALPELSEDLRSQLLEHLPPTAGTRNPVDMIASAGPDEYRACLGLLLASGEVDAIVVVFTPTDAEGRSGVARAVVEAIEAHPTEVPVLGVFMGSAPETADLTGGSVNVPLYGFPESAAQALAAAVRYGEWRDRPEGEFVRHDDVERPEVEALLRAEVARLGPDGGWLPADLVDRVLGRYGIRTARGEVARSADEAAEAAARIGGPVVLKVVAPSVVHKSDIGGVVLGVEGDEAVREAYRQVVAAADDADGAVVQAFVPDGHEVIIGMTEDPQFGPLIVFGLGGIFVELMQDVSFRINPLSDLDAREMLSEIRSARLLTGYRGGPAGDLDALQDVLLRVSSLVEHHPEITEIDLNPVKVLPPGEGVVVVDARIRVRRVPGSLLPSRKDVPGRMQ